jgi:hypothetical protein
VWCSAEKHQRDGGVFGISSRYTSDGSGSREQCFRNVLLSVSTQHAGISDTNGTAKKSFSPLTALAIYSVSSRSET